MRKVDFSSYSDPFKGLSIHMGIICDLEQGGHITSDEAYSEVKSIYKQWKKFHKKKTGDSDKDEQGYYK